MIEVTVPRATIPARAPFGGLLAAEWIKLRSLRSTYAVLGLGAFALIANAIARGQNTVSSWPYLDEVNRKAFSPMSDAFNGVSFSVLLIVVGSLGALSIVGEYSNGMIRTTFTAVPDRIRVVSAKVLVLTGLLLVYGVVICGIAFWVSQAILSSIHTGVSIGEPGVFRAVAATVLLLPIGGLIGMGIGVVLRHTAAAIVGVCVVLVVIPASFSVNVHRWLDDLMNLFPYTCWKRLVQIHSIPPNVPVPSITESWLVYLVWPTVAVLATLILVRRRDV
jgi:ABC-2 type transport system permease protein